MKQIKSILIFAFFFTVAEVKAQSNTSKCSLKILKVSTQNVFGRNMGYIVRFKNEETKTIDGIAWVANFYDRFGELKGKKEGKWTSGTLVDPAEPEREFSATQGAWIKDADDVFITVTKIHYEDGTICK